jgi:serine protease Do
LALLSFYATGVPHLALGSAVDAIEGQRMPAIGNPEGLDGTVSEGTISAFRENRSVIQITAPISHGSSGSPVIDESGQILGITKGDFPDGENLIVYESIEEQTEALEYNGCHDRATVFLKSLTRAAITRASFRYR